MSKVAVQVTTTNSGEEYDVLEMVWLMVAMYSL